MGQKAVLFDMDGVVIDNLPYHVDAWLLYCERHGIHLTREIFYKDLNGLNSKDTFEWLLKREFAYAFDENKYPGVPEIEVHYIENKPFEIEGVSIIPIKVRHYFIDILGFRFGDFTYITDANFISDEELEKAKGSKILVINALRKTSHVSHFNLAEALEVIEKIKPEKAYITHLSHMMGLHAKVQAELPEHVFLAQDGLKITI